jgi:hypothetical protein
MGCPDLETLAAFVDGTLTPAERRSVVVHLASCAACYEVVTETLHGEEEATEEEAEPVPAPVVLHPRFRRRTWWLAAVAAVLVVAVLLPGLRDGGAWHEVAEGVVVADYSDGWGAPEGSPHRGKGAPSADSFSDLRVGALLADVQVAIQSGNRDAVEERLDTLMRELNGSLNWRAQKVRDLRETVKSEGLTPAVHQGIVALRDDLASRPGMELRLGFWAEIGRLAVASGDDGLLRERRWRRQLREFEDADLAEPLPDRLKALRQALEEEEPRDIEAQLTRLLLDADPAL